MMQRDCRHFRAADDTASASASSTRGGSGQPDLPPTGGGSGDAASFVVDQAMTARLQSAVFPQSVASGDPASDGIVLWTRVQPVAPVAASPATLAWQIAATPDFAVPLLAGVAVVPPDSDGTVRVFVQDPLLQPFTAYCYRFVAGGVSSRTGRFKTLPAADAALDSLRLGVTVCQDYNAGYFAAYRHLAREPIDFVLFLGDYVYEYSATDDAPTVRDRGPLPSGADTPATLADYRALYAITRADPDLQAAHENFAWIQLWDDHEFGNDCHQDLHPDNLPDGDTAATPLPALRQAASQAWAEYSPSRVAFDPAQDWRSSVRLYRAFEFGTLASLVATDQRLYRDGPPCGNATRQRYAHAGCAERLDPARTMLGAEQRDWFVERMTGSAATWKLWANEVMLMQLKVGPLFLDLDQWDGYPAERAAILDALGEAGVSNLVALTGDLHAFLAGELRVDFDDRSQAPVGVELMVGSVTSYNLADQIVSKLDLDKAPVKILGLPYDLVEPLVRATNPHIRYFNAAVHGYMTVTLTPERLRCVFKGLRTTATPDAALIDPLATFEVLAGEAFVRKIDGF